MIKLICVGKIKENYIKEGINEFTKRLDRFEIVEIKDSNPKKEAEEIVRRTRCACVLDKWRLDMESEQGAVC